MFVLSEQFERFQVGEVTDGRLIVLGLIDPKIFDGFASVAIMSASLERTIIFQNLVEAGHSFTPHEGIEKRLRFRNQANGHLLTIHYAVEDGNWSKHKRNKQVRIEDETVSVNDLIVCGTLDLFGDADFVWLMNKDIEETEPFGEAGVILPHTTRPMA